MGGGRGGRAGGGGGEEEEEPGLDAENVWFGTQNPIRYKIQCIFDDSVSVPAGGSERARIMRRAFRLMTMLSGSFWMLSGSFLNYIIQN